MTTEWTRSEYSESKDSPYIRIGLGTYTGGAVRSHTDHTFNDGKVTFTRFTDTVSIHFHHNVSQEDSTTAYTVARVSIHDFIKMVKDLGLAISDNPGPHYIPRD